VAETKCEIRLGDCAEVLREYPNGFFDLIVTSPPYADSRARTYGGVKPSQYVEWFLARAEEFLRVLKPGGTFILNIKEKVVGGHAVMAAGYNDREKRFLIRNSWGSDWGRKGYFTMPFAYLADRNLSDDFWTIRASEEG